MKNNFKLDFKVYSTEDELTSWEEKIITDCNYYTNI